MFKVCLLVAFFGFWQFTLIVAEAPEKSLHASSAQVIFYCENQPCILNILFQLQLLKGTRVFWVHKYLEIVQMLSLTNFAAYYMWWGWWQIHFLGVKTVVWHGISQKRWFSGAINLLLCPQGYDMFWDLGEGCSLRLFMGGRGGMRVNRVLILYLGMRSLHQLEKWTQCSVIQTERKKKHFKVKACALAGT